jgi:hypothetical protein
MSRTGGKQTSLSKAIRELEKCDVSGLRGDWRDAVVELSTILDQISRIRRGEIRIVVAGAVASMKSTTLALLLGSRAILRVGLGQGYCVVPLGLFTPGFPVVTAVMRSWGRWLASRVASAMLVAPLTRWYPIEVLRRVANTAGPFPVRA